MKQNYTELESQLPEGMSKWLHEDKAMQHILENTDPLTWKTIHELIWTTAEVHYLIASYARKNK